MKKLIIAFLLTVYCLPAISKAEIKSIIEGKIDAKIKIVLYESLTCSHCASFHKEVYPLLKENFIDNGLVSIEFKSFPLDIAALNASKIAHCRNDGKSEILHYLYKNQNQWIKGNSIQELNKNLKSFIEKTNYNLDFEKCINDKKIEDYILEERINGHKKFEIKSTPTVIILGKKFEKQITYKNLKKYLEKLI